MILRYFVQFAYNGKAYCGWQVQPHLVSIQEVIEKTLSTLLRTSIVLVGAGRTDSGVHARKMFAHFDYEKPVLSSLTDKMNAFLPKDIVVYGIYQVDEHIHARFDAIKRTYQYLIVQQKNPFLTDFAYYFRWNLDIDLMNEACEILCSYQDFQCFSKSKTDVKTYLCKIENAFWKLRDDGVLVFEISADRFLRNMVRAIVGTMLNVGQKKMTLDRFRQVIESKNRSNAGFSVPAHGLYLTEVQYPKQIELNQDIN